MSETIPVLVNGAKGRMGREVVKAVENATGLELVGALDLGDDLNAEIGARGARVVVDFTQPAVAVANTEAILGAGACPVIGTTGFQTSEIEQLQARSRELKLGGLIAPNFAIGAVLLMKFAAEAARYLPAVEIIELHHDQKLDAPSGTAMRTAEWIRRDAGASLDAARGDGGEAKETVAGVRGGRYQDITVHSVRLPGYVAHQEVLLGGEGQVLSIRHDSTSRSSFMPGVVMAVRKVPELESIHYGLESILDL